MKEFELQEGMALVPIVEEALTTANEKLSDHDAEEVRKFALMLEIMKTRGCFPLMGKHMTNRERLRIQCEAYEEAYGEPMPGSQPLDQVKTENMTEPERRALFNQECEDVKPWVPKYEK